MVEGLGIKDEEFGNAFKSANMPTFKKMWEEYPKTQLVSSGVNVGLEENQTGNCEMGHLLIGAGRVVKQPKLLADEFFSSGYKDNELFVDFLTDNESRIHIVSVLSGDVMKSSIEDLVRLYNILIDNNFKFIYFHLITDGEYNTQNYINVVQDLIKKSGVGSIATVVGSCYGLDNTSDFNKTKVYYDLLTLGRGISVIDINKGIKSLYEKDCNDSTLKPMVIDYNGLVKDNDKIVCLNYNMDSSKQILMALSNPNFEQFPTKDYESLTIYSLFSLEKKYKINAFLDKDIVSSPLGVYLSDLDLNQARIASSDRFVHVTEYFDGYYKGKLSNCDRFEIKPDYSMPLNKRLETCTLDITKRVMKCMEKDYDFILANYSCVDEIAHNKDFESTIKMLEFFDKCLEIIMKCAEDNFYKVILTSDHGNCDTMFDELREANNLNTISDVPLIINDKNVEFLKNGNITMIAPTILQYMDIAIPDEMLDTPTLIKE